MRPSEGNRSQGGRWSALVALVLLGLAIGWASGAPAAPGASAGGDRLGVEISFVRAEQEGRFRCATTVKDLVAGTVLAEPELVLPEGENATVTVGVEGADGELTVTAFVSEDGKRLDHAVVLRRGGEIAASQSLTFHFDG